jgi:hypothetical protein
MVFFMGDRCHKSRVSGTGGQVLSPPELAAVEAALKVVLGLQG